MHSAQSALRACKACSPSRGSGVYTLRKFLKASAMRLNLVAILANNTDYSEEFDSLPASLTLPFSGSGKFNLASSVNDWLGLPLLEPPLKEPLVDAPSLVVGVNPPPP